MDRHQQLWMAHFPRFADSGDASLRQMMSTAKLAELPAGSTVFYPGADCRNYVLVLAGAIRARMLIDSGRELLLYQVGAGESCVLTTSCLLGGAAYPAEGVTEDEVTVFSIAAPDFFRALDGSKFFREFVFSDFSRRLSKVIARMEELASGDTDRRLARLLPAAPGGTVGKTHQEIAVEIGTAREVVSRHLKRLEQRGWVRLGRGTVEILDPSALQVLAGGNREM